MEGECMFLQKNRVARGQGKIIIEFCERLVNGKIRYKLSAAGYRIHSNC